MQHGRRPSKDGPRSLELEGKERVKGKERKRKVVKELRRKPLNQAS
jgi:hypothetical protein